MKEGAHREARSGSPNHPVLCCSSRLCAVNYGTLHCDLNIVDPKSVEFKAITQFLNATQGRPLKLIDAWSVNRAGESQRFAEHDKLDNRKLLWHGACVPLWGGDRNLRLARRRFAHALTRVCLQARMWPSWPRSSRAACALCRTR